ncbi:MAG TPA: pyridoxal phosphate-dependent aminotransferase [Pyrinomonadaceae bacterium]|nr:pyridoxal phosphate-dependent aminotransferase [Pyrinomonadaceae bacterium]
MRNLTTPDTLRMRAVQTPVIPVVGQMVREHPGTISLGQGIVSYGPPPEAISQISSFLSDPNHHKYGAVEGIGPLIEAIKTKLRSENNINPGAGIRVVVTAGGNMAFMNAILAVTDPGDEVILQLPYYFNHEMALVMASCRAVLVPTDENYQLRPEAVRRAITKKTRAVVTISPNNPTGAVYKEESLREINETCRAGGIYHISDEAYEYFTYGDARHFSPASIPESFSHTISLYSLSKSYGFASWRIGYMVIPDHLFMSVRKIQDTILICPPVVSQFAALGALEAGVGYCRDKLQSLAEVRGIVLHELRQIESLCTVPSAHGAFYFLPKIHARVEAMTLVERLIREHGVAVIPGTAFGLDDGCYLRVAYGALEKETVVEGVTRLVVGLKTILKG